MEFHFSLRKTRRGTLCLVAYDPLYKSHASILNPTVAIFKDFVVPGFDYLLALDGGAFNMVQLYPPEEADISVIEVVRNGVKLNYRDFDVPLDELKSVLLEMLSQYPTALNVLNSVQFSSFITVLKNPEINELSELPNKDFGLSSVLVTPYLMTVVGDARVAGDMLYQKEELKKLISWSSDYSKPGDVDKVSDFNGHVDESIIHFPKEYLDDLVSKSEELVVDDPPGFTGLFKNFLVKLRG